MKLYPRRHCHHKAPCMWPVIKRILIKAPAFSTVHRLNVIVIINLLTSSVGYRLGKAISNSPLLYPASAVTMKSFGWTVWGLKGQVFLSSLFKWHSFFSLQVYEALEHALSHLMSTMAPEAHMTVLALEMRKLGLRILQSPTNFLTKLRFNPSCLQAPCHNPGLGSELGFAS